MIKRVHNRLIAVILCIVITLSSATLVSAAGESRAYFNSVPKDTLLKGVLGDIYPSAGYIDWTKPSTAMANGISFSDLKVIRSINSFGETDKMVVPWNGSNDKVHCYFKLPPGKALKSIRLKLHPYRAVPVVNNLDLFGHCNVYIRSLGNPFFTWSYNSETPTELMPNAYGEVILNLNWTISSSDIVIIVELNNSPIGASDIAFDDITYYDAPSNQRFSTLTPTTGQSEYTQIYENFPESLRFSSSEYPDGAYLCETRLIPGKTYASEFYNFNYLGKDVKLGVAIVNKGTRAQTVYVYDKCKKVVAGTGSGYDGAGSTSSSQVLQWDYSNYARGERNAYTVNPGSAIIILSETATNGQAITGKVRFGSHIGRSLYARTFCINDDLAPAVNTGASCSPDNIPVYNLPELEGTLTYDGVHRAIYENQISTYFAEFDYKKESTSNNFILNTNLVFNSLSGINPNEYKSNVSNQRKSKIRNDGNYGVKYSITINNASGKYLVITPGQLNTVNQKYLMNFPGSGGWTIYSLNVTDLYGNHESFWIPITSDTFNLDFVLPGGCSGTVYCNVGY